MDRVELVFTPEALEEIAARALGQKTGARGLRTVVEEALLDLMFEIPSSDDIRRCTITDRVIRQEERARLDVSPSPLPADEDILEPQSA
jgi:ATP-dependent Clp protease ATP-binding subunit ClpX